VPAQQATGGDASSSTAAPHSWTEVVKKERKQKPPPATATTDKPVKPKPVQQRTRKRPSAILVSVGADEFPELARKIRGGASSDVIGDSVVGMRQAKSGGLLIEVRGDRIQVEAFRAEVAKSAGSDIEVRTLQQRVLLEVRDLDQWASSSEVLDAVCSTTGSGQEVTKVVSLRKRFGDSQMALVSLPLDESRGLVSTG